MTGSEPPQQAASAEPEPSAAAYDAFISYSHQLDGDLAAALQSALHRYAKPWYRLRALRVFLDRASLSDPALWSSIERAIRGSRWFILVASPEAAASAGVAKEIGYWRALRSEHNLIVVLADGEIEWDDQLGDIDWQATTALPAALTRAFSEEPRFLDLRWTRGRADLSLRDPRFKDAVADLAAPVHGRSKDEIAGEDVRRHRRVRQLVTATIAVLAALALATGGAALVALDQRDHARTERDIATSRLLASRANEARDTDLPLSLLAGVEALDAADTGEAREALLRSLQSNPRIEGFVHGVEGSATFSPDGAKLAYFSDGRVQVWDREAGRVVATSDPMPRSTSVEPYLADMTFDPTGDRLVLATAESLVADWRFASGPTLGAPLRVGDDAFAGVALAPDGQTVAASDNNGLITVWDLATRSQVGTPIQGHVPATQLMRFSPDSSLLASGSDVVIGGATTRNDGAFVVWDLATRAPVTTPLQGGDDRVSTLAFSADGQAVASGDIDGTVYVWDLRRPSEPRVLPHHTENVLDLAFSRNGRELLTASADKTAVLWDLPTGTVIDTLQAHDGPVDTVVMDPSGATVATKSGSEVILWSLAAAQPRLGEVLARDVGMVSDLSFSPNGRFLAVASETGDLSLWDVAGRTEVAHATVSPGPRDFIDDQRYVRVAFSPDGRDVATSTLQGPVTMWPDWERAGLHPDVLTELGPETSGAAFSSDGTTLATALPDHSLALWDVGERKPLGSFPGPSGDASVSDVLFAPGNDTLAAYTDTEVHFWRDRREEEPSLSLPPSPIRDVRYDAAGERLAVGLSNGTIRVVDASTRQPLVELSTDVSRTLYSVAMRPDGEVVATGHADGIVRLWDLQTEQQVGLDLVLGRGDVRAVAFSPDGSMLAAGTDGSAVLWTVGIDELRGRACALAGRDLERDRVAQAPGIRCSLSTDLPRVTRRSQGIVV